MVRLVRVWRNRPRASDGSLSFEWWNLRWASTRWAAGGRAFRGVAVYLYLPTTSASNRCCGNFGDLVFLLLVPEVIRTF